ncbi:MAG TPA: hypothetical protein VER58_11255 [Thermoanaerobaculia bacterium]|nr:hypothetical protein [Thermoanaerobaculia bacterium]
MNTKKIDDQIRDYYTSQGPSPHTVARLKQMMRSGAPQRSRRRVWIASAAVLVIALATLIWTASRGVESPQQVAAVVAHQAALGHNEKQELEFRVGNCAELQRQMKSLDFTLVEPGMMKEMNMRIVGARYATLAGEMAAQILYVDPHGVPCTLYEARSADQLARVATGDHLIDGLRVSVWKEKGLVMVLARPTA